MSVFIDTNMAVGYSLICDKWHEKVMNFIDNCFEDIFWSNCVQSEFKSKFNKIVNSIESFLNKVSFVLDNEKTFLNYLEFEKYILSKSLNCKLDKTKKIKIIEFFWNTKINDNYVPGLYFIEFTHELKKEYKKRRESLENRVILYNCGFNNHITYRRLSDTLINMGIHHPDNRIILDANDLSFQRHPLSFVTTDKKMYDILSKTKFLNITNYILVN